MTTDGHTSADDTATGPFRWWRLVLIFTVAAAVFIAPQLPASRQLTVLLPDWMTSNNDVGPTILFVATDGMQWLKYPALAVALAALMALVAGTLTHISRRNSPE